MAETPGFPGPYREVMVRRSEDMVPLLEDVMISLTAMQYGPRDRLGIWLTLEEAIVNGLRHGNGRDPSKVVRVRYRVDAAELFAEVEDQGPGFDVDRVPDPTLPENLEDPGGRGLLLMSHYMTSVLFFGAGNRVLLHKRRSA